MDPVAERPEEWRDRALCAQTDPDAFFPEKGAGTRDAKRVCRSCDVRAECLEFALDNGERWGVWGGMSERERRRLHLEREAASPRMCGTGEHLMDEANTYVYPNGHRACRECRSAHDKRRREAA